MQIRAAERADLAQLRAIYRGVVEALGPRAYTPGQVAVWAGFASAPDFEGFILDVHSYVAVDRRGPIGFCGIADDGHVASVYVSADHLGLGVGTALLRHALAAHPTPHTGRFYAEASAFSLPLFLGLGFAQCGSERVERGGERFERWLVERALAVPSRQTRED